MLLVHVWRTFLILIFLHITAMDISVVTAYANFQIQMINTTGKKFDIGNIPFLLHIDLVHPSEDWCRPLASY